MIPLVRWTIGNTTSAGYECLKKSIESFRKFYECEVIVCYNCNDKIAKECIGDYQLFNQHDAAARASIKPQGVSWKLYPPRLDESRYEIVIDNDIVFEQPLKEIHQFLNDDCTLLLQGDSRTYGRFERYVPEGYEINSGIYGMPPKFSLDKYVNFYCKSEWEINAHGIHKESKTFDEQGLIALALLNYHKFVIISNTSVTNCERQLEISKAMHFIGLNRIAHHRPYKLYRSLNTKIHL